VCLMEVRQSTTYLPLRDGTRLAVHLWLPTQDDALVPSPAILEYLPYWQSVWTAQR
jgi:predicted acyl esterase